jgi:hypothetical protein
MIVMPTPNIEFASRRAHFVHAALSIFEHVFMPTAAITSSSHTERHDFMIAGVQKKEISRAADPIHIYKSRRPLLIGIYCAAVEENSQPALIHQTWSAHSV